ncbi:MAG TPA: OmpH family outer membrane protein [Thermoanaerobaculia bacterium]|nr:OmpH family outer membrane protein [Thermoanaerobaculia bacterium]
MPLIARCRRNPAGSLLGLALAAALAAAPLAAQAPRSGAGAAPAAGAAGTAAAAAASGAIRIAVIDTEKILLGSQAGKKALAELKKAQDQKEAELRGKQQEIKDLQEKLSQGRLSLAQDKLAELEKQLLDREKGLGRLQEDANTELNNKKNEMLGLVDEKVMPVINQLGKEFGYTLIFRKFESGLIYADDTVDITSTIIQRMDAVAQGK